MPGYAGLLVPSVPSYSYQTLRARAQARVSQPLERALFHPPSTSLEVDMPVGSGTNTKDLFS